LKDSKIIIDIYTPSLADYLRLIKSIKETEIEEKQELLSIFLNIQEIYVPNIAEFKKSGVVSFFTFKTLKEKLDFFYNLNPNDGNYITKKLRERIMKHAINYRTPERLCNFCKQENKEIILPTINIDFEDLFFRKILQ